MTLVMKKFSLQRVYHENLNWTENRGFFCKTYRNRPTGNILKP